MQKMIGVTYSWGDCAMDYHSLQVLILHKNVQASCRVNDLPLRKHTRHGKTFSTHSSYNFCTHLQSMMPLFRSVELIYENLSLQRYAKAAGTVVMRTSSKHDTVLRFIDFDGFRFVTVHGRKRVESDLTISSWNINMKAKLWSPRINWTIDSKGSPTDIEVPAFSAHCFTCDMTGIISISFFLLIGWNWKLVYMGQPCDVTPQIGNRYHIAIQDKRNGPFCLDWG